MVALEGTGVRTRAAQAWRVSERVGLHEVVIVVVSFLIYFVVRGMVVDRAGQALANAFDLIALERRLGIYWELRLQSAILGSYVLIKTMNWIYFWGHMPLIIVFAVWLYVRHHQTYSLVRNAFLASGAIAVVIYATFPVAPPRLVPFAGFVDTMAIFDRVGYNAQEVSAFVNPFAAVPSLHFGWSLLLGAVIVRVAGHPVLKLFGVLWPIAMFLAVVMTGNHFILDAVAGAVVSFAGLGVAVAIAEARPYVRGRLAAVSRTA
ncbi:MAG: phosphatase PAP2 family protein [Hyphomicrobiales bacterium]